MTPKVFLVPLNATDEQLGELYDLLLAEQERQDKEEAEELEKGGPGSGNHDHLGRPGQVGGSGNESGVQESFASGKFTGKPINPNAHISSKMYKDEKGNYTPERAELHKKAIEHYLRGKHPELAGKRVVIIMGGGPSAGKSELLKSGRLSIDPNTVTINADDIMNDFLPEYRSMVDAGNINAAAFCHAEASDISNELMEIVGKKGYSAVLDGTGDGSMEKLTNRIEMMKANGAKVIANYAVVDFEQAFRQMENRYKNEGPDKGRYVPKAYMREVYKEINRLIPEILKSDIVDEMNVYETTDRKNLIKLVTGGKGKTTEILNKDRYEHFMGGSK